MHRRILPPFVTFLFAFAVVLMLLAAAKWIETDGGKTLIHLIDIELSETVYVQGRLYRPLEAKSLNQRPAVLLLSGQPYDKDTLSPIAIELSRRGFVVLAVDQDTFDIAEQEADVQKNLSAPSVIEGAGALLQNQTFVDGNRIGLVGYSLDQTFPQISKALPFFQSVVLFTPQGSNTLPNGISALLSEPRLNSETNLFLIQPKRNEDNTAQKADKATLFSSLGINRSFLFLPLQAQAIQETLQHLQNDLRIPNDLPLWFDANKQRVQIREFFLLFAALFLLLSAAYLCEIFRSFLVKKMSPFVAIAVSIAGTLILLRFYIQGLSRFFLLDFRFITPLLTANPLRLPQFLTMILLFTITVFFFSYSGKFFISSQKSKHQLAKHFLIGGLPILLFLSIEIILYRITRRFGWEYLWELLSNMYGSAAELPIASVFSGTLLLSALLWIQGRLMQESGSRLFSALFCAAIFAWQIIPGL